MPILTNDERKRRTSLVISMVDPKQKLGNRQSAAELSFDTHGQPGEITYHSRPWQHVETNPDLDLAIWDRATMLSCFCNAMDRSWYRNRDRSGR